MCSAGGKANVAVMNVPAVDGSSVVKRKHVPPRCCGELRCLSNLAIGSVLSEMFMREHLRGAVFTRSFQRDRGIFLSRIANGYRGSGPPLVIGVCFCWSGYVTPCFSGS